MTTPEARVRQFIADFQEHYDAVAPIFRTPEGGFDAWRPRMAELTRRHFLPTTTVRLDASFSTPPEHGTDVEQVLDSTIDGDRAVVRVDHDHPLTFVREYSLAAVDGTWWIDRIATYRQDPGAPYLSADEIALRRADCGPRAELRALPEREAHLDPGSSFVPREVILDGDRSGTVEVHAAGSLHTDSGVLCVIDFGYDNDDAEPLARTVAPGTYPVEVSTVLERNAALRVVLGDAAPVAWHPADLPGGGHVAGVDAGNLCVADFVTYAGLDRRRKETEYDAYAAAPHRPATRTAAFGGPTVSAVVADSGWGDGAYPAYWGVDASGQVVQLVVDFLVLVEEDEDGLLRHV